MSELEIEHEGLRLRVRRDGAGPGVTPSAALAGPSALYPLPPEAAASGVWPASGVLPTGVATPASDAADTELELAVVKSPIVGTFYRSPEPTAPAFVEVGSTVKKGQVLCIIEAMKLLNEIDSGYDGEVVNVYVENGQPVQYGERLFAIRTK